MLIEFISYFDLIKTDQICELFEHVDLSPEGKLIQFLIKVFEFINFNFYYSLDLVEKAKINLASDLFDNLKLIQMQIKDLDASHFKAFLEELHIVCSYYIAKTRKIETDMPIGEAIYTAFNLIYYKIFFAFVLGNFTSS
jgi:hypothetical protein